MKYSDPISIILVYSGSGGERLLFRYPYTKDTDEIENDSNGYMIKFNQITF